MKLTRRTFASLAAAAPAALAQQPAPPPAAPEQRRGTPPEVPPFEGPPEFSRKDVPPKVRLFAMTQMLRLLDGPFKDAQEWNRGYMSRLPVDRLVRNFRVNAGLSTDAKLLCGWEQPNNGQKLHRERSFADTLQVIFIGQRAQLYASTGDAAAKTKGDEIVDRLLSASGNWRAVISAHFLPNSSIVSTHANVGAVLHGAQDHGGPVRYESVRREQAGVWRIGSGCWAGSVDHVEIRGTYAGHPRHGIQRNE